MGKLHNLRVAVLATDGFEESELTEPVKALHEAGAHVDVVSKKPGTIQALRPRDKSIQAPLDRAFGDVHSSDYDALMLPGGAWNADALRVEPAARRFVREMDKEKKPIAAICHAPWLLSSAGVVSGRTLTSYPTIEDDIRNAGGHWVDREVACDRNWIASRGPKDLPAFNKEMISIFAYMAQPAAR